MANWTPVNSPARCGGTLNHSMGGALGTVGPAQIWSDDRGRRFFADAENRRYFDAEWNAERVGLKRAHYRHGERCNAWFAVFRVGTRQLGDLKPVAVNVDVIDQAGSMPAETMAGLTGQERPPEERLEDDARTRRELAASAKVHADYDASRPSFWDDLGDSWRNLLDGAGVGGLADAAKYGAIAAAGVAVLIALVAIKK